MILNLLNLYSLIWALFGKIKEMTDRMGDIKKSQENITTTMNPHLTPSTTTSTPSTQTSTVPSSSIESIFSKVTEIFDQTTTDYATDPTEVYDYSNTNYFEDEEPPRKISTTVETSSVDPFMNFTESLFNFTEPFYIDNDFATSTDFYSN